VLVPHVWFGLVLPGRGWLVRVGTCKHGRGMVGPSPSAKLAGAAQFPNTAGLFVGGMFLSFGLVGIAGAIYYFWNKRKTTYTGLA
jgi:hypothetical protein